MSDPNELRQRYLNELAKVDGIQVQAMPLYPYMTPGIRVQMPVLFRVTVGDFSQKLKRDPVHICLVLDRSGSMSGSPLRNCKTAIKNVIARLDPSDLVSLVVYDSDAEVTFSNESPANVAALGAIVDRIQSRGMTNISGALSLAVKCLLRADSSHQKVVFLFSDGQANKGITDLDSLGSLLTGYVKEQDVQFSSFGIGSSYNEEWMRAIARAGKGNYFYVRDMESIADIVERGLAGFTSVVCQNAVLKMRGNGGHALTEIQTVKSVDVLLNGYKLHNMRSLGLYTLLAMVEVNPQPQFEQSGDVAMSGGFEVVPAQPEQQIGVSHLLEYELDFTPVDRALGLTSIKGHVNLIYTKDASLLQERTPDVMCHMALIDCVPIDQAVDDALKAGKVEEAIRLKEEIIAKYEEVVEFDKYGVVDSMLARARNMIEILREQGATDDACKYQGQATGWGQKAKKQREKCQWEAEDSEDDEDMGFGCFD